MEPACIHGADVAKMIGELDGARLGAIGDRKPCGLLLEKRRDDAAGRAARAQQHDMRSREVDAERLAHCGGEAVAVGVEAPPPGVRPAKRVDGAHRPRGRIDRRDAIEGDDLVRHGEIDAPKFLHVQQFEGTGKIVR